MTDRSSAILYVADVPLSTGFYRSLLGREPVEASPGFAMFVLPSGMGLGLWRRDALQPAPSAGGGGAEIAFRVTTPAEVDSRHADWQAQGVAVLMPPADLDFGRSFLGCDPDGHRLRVYALAEG